ncbi:MAG: GH25 family lysozyme [Clostridia bacterium]|nr:GH25 family lysozyme [Clostridia bacterium]
MRLQQCISIAIFISVVLQIGIVASYADEKYDFVSIESGCYYIKNINTGLYLTVDMGDDNNQQNVSVSEKTEDDSQRFMLYDAPEGIYLRPESSSKSGRVLNADADNVKSGNNVNIFNFFAENTMMWKLSKQGNAFIIHNSNNTDCFVTVNENGNAKMTDKVNGENILWSFERTTGKETLTPYTTLDVVNDTNAIINATAFNPNNKEITEMGFVLFDKDKNKIKGYSEKNSTYDSFVSLCYDTQKTLDMLLSPDTTYMYSFYVVIDGIKITTKKTSFKTERSYTPIFAYGIDVSSWQGSVDWEKVASGGVDFAILRAGFTDGVDNRFEEYYAKARKAGLDLGCYFYTYAVSAEEAKKDANNLIKLIKDKKFEYPVYIDIEDANQQKLDNEVRTEICTTFMKTLTDAGFLAGTYSSLYWYNHMLDKDRIDENGEIWMAHWTESNKTTDTYYGLWQYTSKGKIPGISGNVDLDVSFVNYPDLIKSLGKNGYDKLLCGDIDSDEKVTMLDVVLLQRIIACLSEMPLKNSDMFYCCDVDKDGRIKMSDVTSMQLIVAGLIE